MLLAEVIQGAVGVIRNSDNRFLIAERPVHKPMGGMWEFPGGKVEPGEEVGDALVRELQEELGIKILNYTSLIQVHHDYPDYSVVLHVYLIEQFEGEAEGMEGQQVRWVFPEELCQYKFPEASPPILEVVMKKFAA